VNRSFLLHMLGKCGFGGKSYFWVAHCISSMRFSSIFVNNTPTRFFCSSCGLRQGEPFVSFVAYHRYGGFKMISAIMNDIFIRLYSGV
jgi:hypothetical protein